MFDVGIRLAVADPGFLRGGGANSPGGTPTYDFAKISQKLHEIERIWAPLGGGTHPKFYYVDLPLPSLSRVNVLENLFLFKLLIKRELYKKFECIIIKYK